MSLPQKQNIYNHPINHQIVQTNFFNFSSKWNFFFHLLLKYRVSPYKKNHSTIITLPSFFLFFNIIISRWNRQVMQLRMIEKYSYKMIGMPTFLCEIPFFQKVEKFHFFKNLKNVIFSKIEKYHFLKIWKI